MGDAQDSRQDGKPPLAVLPKRFEDWIVAGGRIIVDEDGGDWEVEIGIPSGRPAKHVPSGSLEIAKDGFGDFLFLSPNELGVLGNRVFVYWHEGPSIEVFAENIEVLIAPPFPAPSTHPPVFFYGSDLPVQLNDEVELRIWYLFKRVGVVTYVPGISEKDKKMEHSGLAWVGIRTNKGEQVSVIVTEANTLEKDIKLIRRGCKDKEAEN